MPKNILSQNNARSQHGVTVAAAYARFSSDRQREESIEIQMEAIQKLVEREGWVMGPRYHDSAMSGTNDRRPAFQRCIAAAEDGAYDVLVIYKQDRFARNVEESKRYMRRLRAAGVRVVSVREGELEDTPDGFLRESIGEVFAEYYSRNLSVLVKDGMRKSAEQYRSVGYRVWGYTIDETDHYQIDEVQAAYVAEIYRRYIAGQSANEIRDWLTAEGVRTPKGYRWTQQQIMQMLGNPTYKGTYHYCGVVADGVVPAIVSPEDWDRVQLIRKRRKNSKRLKRVNDYILTEKCYCLRCGRPMCGTAGTSSTGKKYTYYGCMGKDGCRLRVPSGAVEDAVTEAVTALLSDEESKRAIVADLMAWQEAQPLQAPAWRRELAEVKKKRDRLVAAVAEGMPYSSVADTLGEAEERMRALEGAIAREEAEQSAAMDEASAMEFLDSFMRGARDDRGYRRILADGFVDKVFVDRGHIVLIFNLNPEGEDFTLEDIQAIARGEFAEGKPSRQKKCDPAGKGGVRTNGLWWALEDLNF